jgi:hypothetical protein
MNQNDSPIGYLIINPFPQTKVFAGYRVVGLCCASKIKSLGSKIYKVNVYPYRQSCCMCGKALVEGQSCRANDCDMRSLGTHSHWCELYSSNTEIENTSELSVGGVCRIPE